MDGAVARRARQQDAPARRRVRSRMTARSRPIARASASAWTRREVRALVDRGLFTPPQAQVAGLVDGVADQGQLEMVIARALGRPDVGITDLESAPSRPAPGRAAASRSCWSTAPSSTGPARSCRSGSAASPARTRWSPRWRSAAATRPSAAVVLRVNSPGGSAFASDVIARAIMQVRAAGKPVIVSMGDLAASGGYYISAPADVVFAEPSTITGSIGIFAIKVNAAQLVEHAGHQRRDLHAAARTPTTCRPIARGPRTR